MRVLLCINGGVDFVSMGCREQGIVIFSNCLSSMRLRVVSSGNLLYWVGLVVGRAFGMVV